jgi:hypothetical protein
MASTPADLTAATLAARTPADRDRYADLLRVVSIGVVVAGHWLMAAVSVDAGGRASGGNVLVDLPHLHALTWLFQVMPLFFLVGGFAHARALASLERRGGGYADFIRSRTRRLLAPTVVFLGVWVSAAVLLEVGGWQTGLFALAVRTVVQPLWFLGVYLGIVAVAPLMLRWHRRHGVLVPVVLGAVAAGVDVVRFGFDVPAAGVVNLAVVWLAAHQLGYLYADGRLTRPVVGWSLTGGGLAAVLLLTVVTGLYPVSMVGMPGEPVSNMNPPTLALLAHAVWLTGAAMLLRRPVSRLLARRRVWIPVVAANGVVMTAFLWHQTALFLVYAVVEVSGVDLPSVGTPVWWLTRPVWLAACAVPGVVLVAAFRRFERPKPAGVTPSGVTPSGGAGSTASRAGGVAALAMVALCLALLGLAITGLDGMLAGRTVTMLVVPMTAATALGLLGGGIALLRLTRSR